MRRAGRVPSIDNVDDCVALLSYRGAARELVARLKYRNARVSVGWLAEGMTALVRDRACDLVTWAPANPAHARGRGFDHGELLARAVAKRLELEVVPLLRRVRGDPLTGRTKAERASGPPLEPRRYIPGRSVLLVDDVVTTGATLASAARTLRSMGATRVFAVAAAYTPRPSVGPTGLAV